MPPLYLTRNALQQILSASYGLYFTGPEVRYAAVIYADKWEKSSWFQHALAIGTNGSAANCRFASLRSALKSIIASKDRKEFGLGKSWLVNCPGCGQHLKFDFSVQRVKVPT